MNPEVGMSIDRKLRIGPWVRDIVLQGTFQ